MQSNLKCIKRILEYIDQNTGVKIDEDRNISLKSTELYTVVSNLSESQEFLPEEIAYNALLCERLGFINCRFERSSNGNTLVRGKCHITDTTLEGEKFLKNNQN